MIDKKISLGTLLTIGTVLASVVYTHGASREKVENVKVEQVKHAKRIDNNSSAIVNLKVGQAKIETKIDERFNKLEELIMDLE
jgi:hypothetical protein